MKRRITSPLLIIVLLISGLTFGSCSVEGDAVTYIYLSLNPSVEFIVDTGGKVVSFNAVNDEGAVLFSDTSLEGVKIETAIEQIVKLAGKCGYLNVEDTDNVVYLTVVNEDAEKMNSIYIRIKARVENFFKSNGIYALMVQGQLSDEMLILSEDYNVSTGHLRIMLKVLELNPDLKFDYLITLSIKDLVTTLHNSFKMMSGVCLKQDKDAYKLDRLNLKTGHEDNVKALFGPAYTALLAELALLESQLKIVTEEELGGLINQLELKKQEIETLKASLEVTYATEFEALKQNYENDKRNLMNSFRVICQNKKQDLLSTFNSRLSQNEDKFNIRKDYAEKRSNRFGSKYDQWLALRESDIFNFIKTKEDEISSINSEFEEDVREALFKAEKYSNLYDYETEEI
jgi:hypothetical protein